MLGTGAAIAMALPGAGQASEGRISFIGAVVTPTCSLIVGGVGTRVIANGIGNEGRAIRALPAAAGTFFRSGAPDCDAAVDTTKTGRVPLVSISFESVNSVEREFAGIISIVYF